MNKGGFEFSDKQLKKALSTGIIIFAIFLFVRSFIMDTDRNRYENSLKNIQEENFRGYVVDKGFEKFNHNSSMLYLSNKTKIAVFGEFWAEIKIGDSVEKKKGETIITVYRNKEKFILDNREIIDYMKK